jgi:hypothetical protein
MHLVILISSGLTDGQGHSCPPLSSALSTYNSSVLSVYKPITQRHLGFSSRAMPDRSGPAPHATTTVPDPVNIVTNEFWLLDMGQNLCHNGITQITLLLSWMSYWRWRWTLTDAYRTGTQPSPITIEVRLANILVPVIPL